MEKKEPQQEGIDIEHISKTPEFQKVTFDFMEPDLKFADNLGLLLRKSFSFSTWEFMDLIEKISE